MRKKLNNEDKRPTISITINPILAIKIEELKPNKSKYIEWLIYQDLLKNKHIDETFIL